MAETTTTQNQKGEPISLITWVELSHLTWLFHINALFCIALWKKAEVQENRRGNSLFIARNGLWEHVFLCVRVELQFVLGCLLSVHSKFSKLPSQAGDKAAYMP